MIYLKKFETESNYLAYRYDKENYLKPNISLCEGNDMVYYNYPPSNPNFNGHDYVDLGLPSGTLWATCNVGSSKPSGAGQYFQWGDTSGYTAEQIGTGEGKKEFTWADYKWSVNDSSSNFSKYTTTGATLDLEDDAAHVNMGGDWDMPSPEQIQELIDNTTRTTVRINKNLIKGITFKKYTTPGAILELEDDAAHVNMGGDWHMPTPDQIKELINNTTSEWTTQDGVNGMTFTSTNGKSIFIPAAGVAGGGSIPLGGDVGLVWSSMLSSSNVRGGQSLYFNSDGAHLYDSGRYNGRSVRGVLG